MDGLPVKKDGIMANCCGKGAGVMMSERPALWKGKAINSITAWSWAGVWDV